MDGPFRPRPAPSIDVRLFSSSASSPPRASSVQSCSWCRTLPGVGLSELNLTDLMIGASFTTIGVLVAQRRPDN
jgi:hypothetical protein